MKFSYLTKHSASAVFLLLGLGGLGACGNKGPLYIPAPPVEQQQPSPTEQQPPEQNEPSTN